MKIDQIPFFVTRWEEVPPTVHAGEVGEATWRTIQLGDIRIRQIDYSAGYRADHWCSRGHILLVLKGELDTELADGRKFTLRPGMSYQVASDAEPHRSSTESGARLFVVD